MARGARSFATYVPFVAYVCATQAALECGEPSPKSQSNAATHEPGADDRVPSSWM